MIITCEGCRARFNLDEALLDKEGSKVRCSKCKSVFTAYPPSPSSDDDTENILGEPGDRAFQDDDLVSEEPPAEKDDKTSPDQAQTDTKGAAPKEAKPQRVFWALALLLILTGAVYTTYLALESMGVKMSFNMFEHEGKEPGNLNIELSNINGRYVENHLAGTIFVVTGKAKNNYKMPRTYLRVTGRLFTKGKVLAKEETVPCGNILSNLDLATLSKEELIKRLTNPSGNNMSNVDIRPEQKVSFMIIFFDLPEGLDEFVVAPASSLKSKFEK